MTIKRRITVLTIAALVIAGVAGVYYMPQAQQTRQIQGGPKSSQRAAERTAAGGTSTDPVPVLASVAKSADVPVYFDGVGTAKALNTVTVRSQVDGKLIQILFTEGQDVEKGFVLAKIDPVVYQAAYDQTVAKKAQDEAQLANARLDLERYIKLAVTNAVNKQQLDTQRAMVAQFVAQVQLDQAAIDNARAILSYTNVDAPISGRTGIRQVDQGNIIKAADATGIVILTQLQPISIFFNLPQQELPDLNKAFAEGSLPVDALAADGKTALDTGKVVVIDNQIDQTTGTVKLKAEFPNASLQLWPGQFVNVRVLMGTLRQVVVVPTAAIQRGPNGTFVYVIKDDSTVIVRRVTMAQQDDVRSVVSDGLQPDERVVTTGFARLTEGMPVSVAIADAGQATPADQPRPDGTRGAAGQATPAERPRPDGTRGARGVDKAKRTPSSGRPPAINP
jgi:membrane fusion protein, multidrug efflux system